MDETFFEPQVENPASAMSSILKGIDDIKEGRVSKLDRDFSKYLEEHVMNVKDVVYEKVNRIQNYLQRIYKTVNGDLSRLDALDAQEIVTINLQRIVQKTIEIAAYVVRLKSFGMPRSLNENFQLLFLNGVIDEKLKDKMEHMVGFRNVAVHNYESINPDILKSIVKNHLQDIEEFFGIIVKKF